MSVSKMDALSATVALSPFEDSNTLNRFAGLNAGAFGSSNNTGLQTLSLNTGLSSSSPESIKSAVPAGVSNSGGTLTNYTDPSYLASLPFGTHSHWLQPWRAYLETMPASTFINGTGVVLDLKHRQENPSLIVQMLAKHGIRNARIEVSWSDLSYDTEKLNNKKLEEILKACKEWGVRPLLLLNGHQGAPTPIRLFDRKVTASAPEGSRTLQLNDTSGLIVGKSGLNNLTGYWAAEALITSIKGKTVTLSKPLQKAIAANTTVPMSTLKYRPFSVTGSGDYNATISGWKRYVNTVATFATNALSTTKSADKGFDMEIWNELSFGSKFLYINNYYDSQPYKYSGNITAELVKATSDYVVANSSKFQGVKFVNGFANTTPWPASSAQPERIAAIGKHPYYGRKTYPADEQMGNALNALGKLDSYVPTYSHLFPEYYATAIQTETQVRDMGPITNVINEIKHGRDARSVNGKVVPTPVWMTEMGFGPSEIGITDRDAALALKAKATARTLTFFPNKGAERVYLFGAAAGDNWMGVVQDNFLDYARSNTVYPTNDRPYTSPLLEVTSRIVAQMQQQLDPKMSTTRPLKVDFISDTHNHYQFAGDGTTAHSPLYNRDVFAFLPYQVNSKRFVVPYYVMTRDITKELPPEQFTIQISGLNGNGATLTAYDPINNRNVPLTVNSETTNMLNVTLTATDYPYLLTVQEK